MKNKKDTNGKLNQIIYLCDMSKFIVGDKVNNLIADSVKSHGLPERLESPKLGIQVMSALEE